MRTGCPRAASRAAIHSAAARSPADAEGRSSSASRSTTARSRAVSGGMCPVTLLGSSRMAADPDCLFCKIVAGEIPATRVDEDERTIAFMDINPATRGHLLVIPREHAADLLEIPAADLEACARTAKRMATRIKQRLGPDGVNLINSCGRAAWQTVFHFHIHV